MVLFTWIAIIFKLAYISIFIIKPSEDTTSYSSSYLDKKMSFSIIHVILEPLSKNTRVFRFWKKPRFFL